jgi:hypothetical protein
MKITLEQKNQVTTIEHYNKTAAHNPDLLDFARYCEDFMHRSAYYDEVYTIRFIVDARKKFFAYTASEKTSRMLYNYFLGGSYELDLGYDETDGLFYLVGVEKKKEE